jgi:RNA polymerase sigma factor (sigma-70 family)
MTAVHGFGQDEQITSLAVLALKIALRRLCKEDKAEEIAQGAVAAFLIRQQHVRNPEAYVTQVTHNLICARLEERWRYLPTGEPLEEGTDRTQEDPFDRALDRILAEVVLEEDVDPLLTDRERQVLKLRYEDGYSRRKAGELLEVTPETIKDAERRAKRKVRRTVDSSDMGEKLA